MTNKITKVYKNGVEYDIYASGGAAGTGDVTGPSSSTDADIALFSGTTGKIIKDSGKKLSDYQTALSTQTAYSAKGTTTKVPQITTNTLGQVTTITEKSIAFPVTSVNGSTGAVTVTVPTKVSDLSNDAGYTTNTGTITSVKMNGSTVASSGEANLGTVITSHQSIKTINSKTITGSGNVVLYSTATASLGTTGWSNNQKSITVSGVTASNTVIVTPAPANIDAYTSAGIYCSAQASNSLTFKCSTVPSSSITVNVLILN